MITLDQVAVIAKRCAEETGRYCTINVQAHSHSDKIDYHTYIAALHEGKEYQPHIPSNTLEKAYNRFASLIGEPTVPLEESFESHLALCQYYDEQSVKAKQALVDFTKRDLPEAPVEEWGTVEELLEEHPEGDDEFDPFDNLF